MRYLIILLIISLSNHTIAQNKAGLVSIKVIGHGSSRSMAISNALRSAIEQTFGAFISSNTSILNDNLVADEIVSISSGNIQSYTVVSETFDNAKHYIVNLNAVIAVDRLKEYAQSKGVTIEIEGGVFAQNIKQQQLNEDSEVKAALTGLGVIYELLQKSFDYQVINGVPRSAGNGNQNWILPLQVEAKINSNIDICKKILLDLLESLSLSKLEEEEYRKIGKKTFDLDCRSASINNDNYSPDMSQSKSDRHYLLKQNIYGSGSNTVNARHIMIKDKNRGRAKLDTLKNSIEGGANFEELAKIYSDDVGSGKRGGNLGWFGRGTMVQPFEDACFNAPIGSLQIVETEFGWHLIEILNVERSNYFFRREETWKAFDCLLKTWKLYSMCFNIDFGFRYLNGSSSLKSEITEISSLKLYLPGDSLNILEFNVPFSLSELEKVSKVSVRPILNLEDVLEMSMIYTDAVIKESWLTKTPLITIDEIPYPPMEVENKISGTVLIQCIVEKNGQITNVRTKMGVPGGPNLSRVAEAAVKKAKVDGPGMIGKYSCRSLMEVPVVFSLK